ncbi:MAG: PilZ domain-containing protein [Acidobacteriaceae bacterium]
MSDSRKIDKSKGERADRRRHRRYPCNGLANVLVVNGAVIIKGQLLDLSLSGCYIRTKAPLALEQGTYVEMVLAVNGLNFRVPATVTSIRENSGAGIGFLRLNPRMQREMDELMKELDEQCYTPE